MFVSIYQKVIYDSKMGKDKFWCQFIFNFFFCNTSTTFSKSRSYYGGQLTAKSKETNENKHHLPEVADRPFLKKSVGCTKAK